MTVGCQHWPQRRNQQQIAGRLQWGGIAAGLLNALVPRLRRLKTPILPPSRFAEKNEYNDKSFY
jgi:hypothetical protein